MAAFFLLHSRCSILSQTVREDLGMADFDIHNHILMEKKKSLNRLGINLRQDYQEVLNIYSVFQGDHLPITSNSDGDEQWVVTVKY